MAKLKLVNSASIPAGMEALYIESFPVEERREWTDITARAASDPRFSFLTIMRDDSPAGFMTVWNLGRALYVEHFAVDPSLRGKGIGMEAIKELAARSPLPLILEVEPENTGETARRRIAFYTRAGFTAHHSYPYIQPPYSPGLPPVALTLMTTAPMPLDEISSTLHTEIYGCPLKSSEF